MHVQGKENERRRFLLLDVRKGISQEEYESHKRVCQECAYAHTTLNLEGRAYDLEKKEKFAEAKRRYWQIINGGLEGSFPYKRLRIICAQQKEWKGAIKACQAYVDLNASHMGYDVKKKEWIRKYRAKLGIARSYD